MSTCENELQQLKKVEDEIQRLLQLHNFQSHKLNFGQNYTNYVKVE